MSNTSPFLTGSTPPTPAISPPANAPPPTPKPQAAETPALTNSRRVIPPISSPLLRSLCDLCVKIPLQLQPRFVRRPPPILVPCFLSSTQFIQINLRLPLLLRLHHLLPSNFPPRIRRRPRQQARKRRLHPLRRLIMKIPAGNTLHKRLFLLRIRKLQIRSELPRSRKSLIILHRNLRCLPRLVPPNPQRPRVRRLRSPLRPKKSLRNV